jgi:hypothetical protein
MKATRSWQKKVTKLRFTFALGKLIGLCENLSTIDIAVD